MNTQFWLVQAFNGVSYGALLFLVGSGLSLIFGVMRIVNLSHGSYFLLGGYIALSVIHATGSWALSLPGRSGLRPRQAARPRASRPRPTALARGLEERGWLLGARSSAADLRSRAPCSGPETANP